MSLIQFDFESQYLNSNTTIGIIIPEKPHYIAADKFYNRKKKFKVLWLLHGTYGDWSDWVRKTMVELYATENDFMCVMPSALNSDYTSWPSFSLGYDMESHLVKELMPLIYSWFPASSKKEDNYIAGLSMGGFHTLQISANYPMFDYVGLFSPGISGLADYKVELYENLDEKLTKLKQAGIKLYWIGIGKDDFLYKDVEAYRKKLDSLAFPYVYKETDKGHVWTNWRKYLMEFLQLIK